MIRYERPLTVRTPATLPSVFAGLSFIRSRQAVLGAITLDMVAVLLGGATALLPIYAKEILGTGPWGLGILRSAPGGRRADHGALPRTPSAAAACGTHDVHRRRDLRRRNDRLRPFALAAAVAALLS